MAEKEVYFAQYCPQCSHKSLKEDSDPCDECLAQPVNEDSHKPLYFKDTNKTFTKKPSKSTCISKYPTKRSPSA